MPSTMSANAKARVAVGVAVVQAGIGAYQLATRGGRFTWWDVVPIVAAVAAAACTGHVENTINRPAAKAVVHGALSVVSAVSTALAALLATEPGGVSLVKLLVVAAGALLVWYVPEAAPEVKVIEGALMGPDLPAVSAVKPAPAPAAPASTPRQVDAGLPSSAWSLRPVAAGTTSDPTPAPASTPTPIGDAVSGPPTQPFPAPVAPAVAPVPTV